MGEENRGQLREFQLETRHLAAIVVLIAILCISSFLLGRWVERQAYRATAEGALRTGSAGNLSVEDVNKELTYFRTLEDDASPPAVKPAAAPEKPEPVKVRAQIEDGADTGTGAPAVPESPATPAVSNAPASKGYFIQVMATKDKQAAYALKRKLSAKGYSVGISEGSLPAEAGVRRVRVGPFSIRAEAEKAAEKLRTEERLPTWIP